VLEKMPCFGDRLGTRPTDVGGYLRHRGKELFPILIAQPMSTLNRRVDALAKVIEMGLKAGPWRVGDDVTDRWPRTGDIGKLI